MELDIAGEAIMLQTQPDSVYGSNFLGQRAWEEVVARLVQDLRLYDGHIALKAGKTTLSRAR